MDLLALLNGLVAQLADAQKAADDLAKAKFDEGFAAGVASVPVSDKIFSQADVDALLAPLQAQITDLQAQVLALQGSIDQKVSDAVAAVKTDLLQKYQALEVAIQDQETGFENLLK